MPACSQLATTLDEEMLGQGQIPIAAPSTTDDDLCARDFSKRGREVFEELGRRYLLKYIRPDQVGVFTQLGSYTSGRHYTTPTPYSPEETIRCLALPFPAIPRTYVLVLDPRQIETVCGPRWVRWGIGIEYFLPDGFPLDAIVVPGSVGRTKWELVVA